VIAVEGQAQILVDHFPERLLLLLVL
jgi:hypothetical protein